MTLFGTRTDILISGLATTVQVRAAFTLRTGGCGTASGLKVCRAGPVHAMRTHGSSAAVTPELHTVWCRRWGSCPC